MERLFECVEMSVIKLRLTAFEGQSVAIVVSRGTQSLGVVDVTYLCQGWSEQRPTSERKATSLATSLGIHIAIHGHRAARGTRQSQMTTTSYELHGEWFARP